MTWYLLSSHAEFHFSDLNDNATDIFGVDIISMIFDLDENNF